MKKIEMLPLRLHPARSTGSKKSKILIVSNDLNFRHVLFKILAQAGYTVFVAVDCNQAIEFLAQISFSHVLIDLNRPHEGGLQELQMLIQIAVQAKVIVLTAFDENNLKEEVFSIGATDFLIKPAKKKEILRTISQSFERKG